MTDVALALAVHVVAVVMWIGGVGVVATVLVPAIRRTRPPEERFAAFHMACAPLSGRRRSPSTRR